MGGLRAGHQLRAGHLRERQDVHRAQGPPRTARRRAGHAQKPALLPRGAAERVRRHHAQPQDGRARRTAREPRVEVGAVDARDHREALRARSRERARIERDGGRDVQRGAGLPHRPLPRQGDRPEPARVPVRQQLVRAALEPRAHRPRADHGRGGHRRRGAREVLRADGRDARHRRKSPDAAALPDGDGAADLAVGGRGARREGEGAAFAAADGALARARERRARAVRARVRPRGRGRRLPRRRRRRERLARGDVRGDARLRRQLAVGRRAVLRARRQEARAARDGDRDPVQEGAARAVPRARRRDFAERARHAHPARRGHRPALHDEGAGAADRAPRRRDGFPVRDGVRLEHAGGVRAALARRDARRGDALHAARRGRRAVGVLRPGHRGMAGRGERAAAWGPEPADDLIARDGRRWRKP